jgi:hypothetical protein
MISYVIKLSSTVSNDIPGLWHIEFTPTIPLPLPEKGSERDEAVSKAPDSHDADPALLTQPHEFVCAIRLFFLYLWLL